MIPLPRLTMVVAKIKVTTKANAYFRQEMEMDFAILKTITARAVGTVVTAAAQRKKARLVGLNSIFARQTKSLIKKMPTVM
jgi:hypothetical protein